MKTPQIKPHFRIEIVEPKQIYLLAENATHALTGEFYCHLIPLLDGKHDVDTITQTLCEWGDANQIISIIERLGAKGYLIEAVPELPESIAAFWTLLGVEPQVAKDCLQQATIYLHHIGNTNSQPLITSLEEIGIKTQSWEGKSDRTTPHSLLVVLADDYLQPELATINQTTLETHQPWLLAKPVGGLLWLGPIFEPVKTGCWDCLAHRLRGNREVEASVLKQKRHQGLGKDSGCLPTSFAFLPSTQQTALNLIITEIAKWLVCQTMVEQYNFTPLTGKVITLDLTNLNTETHILSKRPQCPTCGNPNILQERGFQPLTLVSRQKHFTTDGGHRAFTPDQTLKNYQHLISPITGVVSALIRSSDPDSDLLHSYHAIHSYGQATTNLNRLRHLLGHKSGGKGKTDRQAKASGFCEAVERYSSIYHGDEPRLTSTLAELGDKAIHPEKVLQFSPYQYANRDVLNKDSSSHNLIAQLFDETQEIEWTPVWSLTAQTHKYLPTAYCYYNYFLPKEHDFCSSDSNGNAAGNTLEEAILQGFMELVERDSVAIWWYNCLQRPEVDLASFEDPYLLDLQAFYKSKNRELWVLDISTDLEIPSFAAISRRIDGEQELIIAGFGTHFDPKIGILRAVTELNQLGFSVDEVESSQMGSWEEWVKHNLNSKTYPYLAPKSQPLKRYEDYPQRWSNDICQDVLTCMETVKQVGLEMLVLDQTRPDIGLNVVKVIVPGLRHFWGRFAEGRLYDVPVKMGLLAEPLAEDKLNPVPMIL